MVLIKILCKTPFVFKELTCIGSGIPTNTIPLGRKFVALSLAFPLGCGGGSGRNVRREVARRLRRVAAEAVQARLGCDSALSKAMDAVARVSSATGQVVSPEVDRRGGVSVTAARHALEIAGEVILPF
ncbi:hypothetical protein Trydic_g3938 [Trypoxylus dichotomus]